MHSALSQHESPNTLPGGVSERRGGTDVLTWSFE